MKAVLEINGVTDRKVYVADSFQGLPPPKPDRFAVDAGDTLYAFDELRVSKQQVRLNFEKYSLLDDNVVFLEGFFEDTLPTLGADRFALLRLDGDMYQSTTEALGSLYPKLSAGGFIIIDDYALPGCRQAVEDYRTQHDIQAPKQQIDWTGIWWQKN
jgi:O-methyltransferase